MLRMIVIACVLLAGCQPSEPPDKKKNANSKSAERRERVYAAVDNAQRKAERALDDAYGALKKVEASARQALSNAVDDLRSAGEALKESTGILSEPLANIQQQAEDSVDALAQSARGMLGAADSTPAPHPTVASASGGTTRLKNVPAPR
jgi:hypothetical protein